jgi:CubicO group peptidase (beta-lactamase class C family)
MKSTFHYVTVCASALLFLVFPSSCNNDNASGRNIQKIDEYLTAQATLNNFNGNVLIAENGKIIFQKSFGYADFTTQRPLNDSSVFELASLSKQITATAILLLAVQGRLKLTDSLRAYFPELPYANITLYQMLTHTSGLPEYEPMMVEKWDHSKIAFNRDMIEVMAKEQPAVLFKPGTKWKYNNTAYALLATIVEKISGMAFPDFLKENIFQPLNMTHSRIYNTRRSLKDTIPNYAYGYLYDLVTKKHTLPDSIDELNFIYFMDGIMGDGTVNSTTGDLLKWDRAIKNHALLKETTQQEMLKSHVLADTMNNRYYGFGVMRDKSDLGSLIAHSGGWPGYATYLARNVEKDQTFIVLSNIDVAPSSALMAAAHHLLNGKTVDLPYAHKAIGMDSATLEKFTGKYKSNFEFTIERVGEKLVRKDANGKAFELTPESDVKFFYSDGADRQIEFELDASTQTLNAWYINYGVRTLFKRHH